MSFITDRIREVKEKEESREVYLLEEAAIKDTIKKIDGVIEETDGWTEENAKPKFHKQLGKYIDAIVVKSMYDSWDLIGNTIDLDCLKLTLGAYQKRLVELDGLLAKKLGPKE